MTDAATVTDTGTDAGATPPDTGTTDPGVAGGTPAAADAVPPAAGVADAANDGGEPAAGDDGADKGDKPNEWLGAPEDSYTNEGIEVPEGAELNDDVCETLAGVCHEMGLSQKSFATIINKMSPVLQQAQEQALASFKSENLKAFAADKELGGAKAKQNLGIAAKAFQKYCPPEARELLVKTGLDTHPGIIKMFYQIAQSISDDVSPRGNGEGGQGDPLARFFNNSKMN